MVLVLLSGPIGQAAAKTPGPAELIGTWRGTSTCTDRVAAPACNDETVVYEFSAGPKPRPLTAMPTRKPPTSVAAATMNRAIP